MRHGPQGARAGCPSLRGLQTRSTRRPVRRGCRTVYSRIRACASRTQPFRPPAPRRAVTLLRKHGAPTTTGSQTQNHGAGGSRVSSKLGTAAVGLTRRCSGLASLAAELHSLGLAGPSHHGLRGVRLHPLEHFRRRLLTSSCQVSAGSAGPLASKWASANLAETSGPYRGSLTRPRVQSRSSQEPEELNLLRPSSRTPKVGTVGPRCIKGMSTGSTGSPAPLPQA